MLPVHLTPLKCLTLWLSLLLFVPMVHAQLPSIQEAILQDKLKTWKPYLERFGCFVYQDDTWLPVREYSSTPISKEKSTIVLVHGLDEIGTIWDDMAPALVQEGHLVYAFRYPNDQGIDHSAALFRLQLETMKRAGLQSLNIVAHSMGGLVARDALTRPSEYGEGMPDVGRLIMIGTPNQGAPLAHLRHIGEWREHVVRLAKGEYDPLDSLFDGMGEAAIDLLPESEYLKKLNARPLPKTKITILAAQMDPTWRRDMKPLGVEWLDEVWNGTKSKWHEWSKAVGDGVVPLSSTKLKGVKDWRVIDGNHRTVLRKFFGSSETPIAVNIVVECFRKAP